MRGQREELCFETAYRNCEFKCVDGTSSDGLWSCLRVCNRKKDLFVTFSHFQTKYDDLQSI